jgi:hypothetical protein
MRVTLGRANVKKRKSIITDSQIHTGKSNERQQNQHLQSLGSEHPFVSLD